MKLGIGVILYNPDEDVLTRLNEYKKATEYLIIIDNSDYSQKQLLTNKIQNITEYYIDMNGNYGMTSALNIIYRLSSELSIDYILTMDQDSDFENEKIYKMLEFIQKYPDKDVGIFCPNYKKMYWNAKKQEYDSGSLAINKKLVKSVSFSMTSASFCNVKYIAQIIPLTNYFIGYVDNDICYHLIKNGLKIIMNGNIYFEQKVGTKVESTMYNRIFNILNHSNERYYYMIRNNLFLQKKYKKNKKIVIKLKINLFRIVLNIFLGEKNKKMKFRSCKVGFEDYKNKKIGKIDRESYEKIFEI